MQDKKANTLDLPQIKKIIALVENSNLSEFEIEQDSFRLKLCKGTAPVISAASSAAQPTAPPAQVEEKPDPAEEEDGKFQYINAPMVGTFYRAPSPDTDNFLEVGQKVNEKSVVCIVEAMKVMNELLADCKGTVAEILVENAIGVEYGQPLFKIALT
ncbi:MAG: acetyl-CoA carboxylase biotin carboxyl carrier protein [Opitutales bacterium]|jgi:acetyl-CoA carboxylase biotin carboxyl carrier protein|nr:acetyl-CoA carboxylase biotin carboxyl carrier protein [Opitutales bacterium]